jgi:nucleoside 2-deoxyribosyltransferase
MIKAYLAGPDVFYSDAKDRGKKMVEMCLGMGVEAHFPLDNEIDLENLSKYDAAKKIFEANVETIKNCDVVLANLKSFRSPSADVGTVWECGFAKGLGKPVFGYTTSDTGYKSKVLQNCKHDGMLIEDFGLFDNLMVFFGCDNRQCIVGYSDLNALSKAIGSREFQELMRKYI